MEDMISNFKYNYLDFNNLNYFQDKKELFYQRIKAEIKAEYEKLDQQLRESNTRKQKGYVIKGYVPRTIITIFGKITFIRTKYQYFDHQLNKHRTVYLLDKQIQIEPYKRMSLHLRLEIMKQLTTGKRQKDISDQFKVSGISLTSISNLIRKLETDNLNEQAIYWNYQIPKEIVEKQFIYINLDDTFINLRDKNQKQKFRIRLCVTHLGYVNAKISRKELLHKRAFYNISDALTKEKISPFEFAKTIYQQLTTFYGDINDKQLIVCGDGARWIKDIAKFLNADFMLDRYHITSLIYNIFPYKKQIHNINGIKKTKANKIIYEKCCVLLNNGNDMQLVNYLKTFLNNNLFINKHLKIKNLINYILNNKIGINNYQKSYYIGSQTEPMVSHLVKSIKGYGAKIYNRKTFINLLNLKLGAINQLEPINLYCAQTLSTLEISKNYYFASLWNENNYQIFK